MWLKRHHRRGRTRPARFSRPNRVQRHRERPGSKASWKTPTPFSSSALLSAGLFLSESCCSGSSASTSKNAWRPGISAKATAASALRINWEEKRAQPRLSVSWNASFAAPHGPERAQLKDISLGGAFVVCPAPLPLSDRFQIVIELPDAHPPRTQCRSGLVQCERPRRHDRQPRDGRSIH